MDTSQNARCSLCPSHALDPLGHHALTCKSGGDLIVRHNALRDTFWESCKLACIGGQLEAGSSLDEEGRQTRPADILVQNWEFGKSAALDFTVTSPLNPTTLNEASVTAESTASAAEQAYLQRCKMQPFGLGLHPFSRGDIRVLGRRSH